MKNDAINENSVVGRRAYERALIRLHRMIARGQGDETEADEIREAMDEYARSLSPEQGRLLDELSGDLYMISGQEIQEPLRATQETVATVTAEIQRALVERRWGPLLHWLRKPSSLTQLQIATLRATAYQALDAQEASAVFTEYARSLERDAVVTAR